MKKIKILSVLSIAVAVSFIGQTAHAHESAMHSTSTGNMVNVHVMKHLCNANIKNMSDFKALETGKDPVAALANTVLNCPTTGLPGDDPVANTVASPRTTYNFKVAGEHHMDQFLATTTLFMQHKISEADINIDVNNDGAISSSTALDISHYEFPNTYADNGRVEVTEVAPPAGYKFGTVRFTPSVIDGNNDATSLINIDDVQGRIQLDMARDTDKTVMLHVYNFRTGAAIENGNETGNGNMGNGSMTPTRGEIISQINSLQTQIQGLFAQILALLAQI